MKKVLYGLLISLIWINTGINTGIAGQTIIQPQLPTATNAQAIAQSTAGAALTPANIPSIEATQGIFAPLGLVGDGAANDRAAIQAALNAAGAVGGGTVILPVGTFNVSLTASNGGTGCLLIPDNTTLRGAGAGTVLKNYDNTYSAGVILNTGFALAINRNIHVADLAIDLGGIGHNGVIYDGVVGGTIDNVVVINPAGYGIWLVRGGDGIQGSGVLGTLIPKDIMVTRCRVTGIVDMGYEADGAVECVFSDNYASGNGGSTGSNGAFNAWNGATDIVFSHNIAEGTGANNTLTGFIAGAMADTSLPTQTQRIKFIGNSAYNIYHGGAALGEPGSVPLDIYYENNSLYGYTGNSTVGIQVAYTTRAVFKNNYVSNFDVPILFNNVPDGTAWNSAKEATIDGNTFLGGQASFLYGFSYGSFSGNNFTGQSNSAVTFYGATNSRINNNSFFDLGTTGYPAGLILRSYSIIQESVGNIVTGNKTANISGTYTFYTVLLVDAADYNVVTGNSAYGARSGANGCRNVGIGINNVIANNIDAP